MTINDRYSLHTITRANGIVECNKHKTPLKSPVVSDKDPEWIIDLHARERNGNTFVCADMHASLGELSRVIALWIVPTLRRMNLSPSEFLHRMADAVENIQSNKGIEAL